MLVLVLGALVAGMLTAEDVVDGIVHLAIRHGKKVSRDGVPTNACDRSVLHDARRVESEETLAATSILRLQSCLDEFLRVISIVLLVVIVFFVAVFLLFVLVLFGLLVRAALLLSKLLLCGLFDLLLE